MKFFKSLVLIAVFSVSLVYGQSSKSTNSKLQVGFNKNIEFFWFTAYIAYETEQIEDRVIVINNDSIPEKEWEAYGYYIYKKYKDELFQNPNLQQLAQVAGHLSYTDFINVLLRVEPAPYAKLTANLSPEYYLPFSRSKDPDEALKNVEIFLKSFNALYRELDFEGYLEENKVFYDKALEEVTNALPKSDFIPIIWKDFFSKNLMLMC